ncbi:hypothetical protein [Ktedonospora formicarum]|uniref:Uncharacterized protein n=1 Tax=Ktedonospora formicarum TaxID=2778364 RepID=A0A8J3HXA6_9CHLR|nr:hypothetical protein [Ktedonospora formicarum]GHO42288.1 hypothetical protein KSX_04510 [Ktedonospora formicarum]
MSIYPDAESNYPSAKHATWYVLDQLDLDDEEKVELAEEASKLGNLEGVQAPLTSDQKIGLDELVPLVK